MEFYMPKLLQEWCQKWDSQNQNQPKIWSLFGCESHFCNALQRAAQHEAAAAAGVTSEMVRRPPWSRLSEGAVGTRDGTEMEVQTNNEKKPGNV